MEFEILMIIRNELTIS